MTLLDIIDKSINVCFAGIPRKSPMNGLAGQMQLIAHRGAHNNKTHLIENTDAAFAAALKAGCWGIELDVHATLDNQLVVNHDATLKRLWGIDSAIADLTFHQLHANAPLIPRLDEVIETYGKKLHLFIELKAPFTAKSALADALQPLSEELDYHLISLNEHIVSSLTSHFSRQSLLLVAAENNTGHFCKLSLANDYGGVVGHYLLLTNTRLKKLQQAGQKVGVGFVDSRFSFYRETNRGLTWIFSNNIHAVRPLI